MTTKDQERQAIARIRRIVEGLGANSYVGTAMEGVLEVAEQNIEYDAAFSLKGEVEVAEKRAREAEKENKQLKGLLEKAQKTAEDIQSKLNETQQMDQKWNMPTWMCEKLTEIVRERENEAERKMIDAANSMADGIGESGNASPYMAEWAAEYKKQRKEGAECANILRMLKRYEDEGGKGNE